MGDDNSSLNKNGMNPLKARQNCSKVRANVVNKPKMRLDNRKGGIKVENISDCKLIISTELNEICAKLSTYENNEEFLEALQKFKIPYLFNSISLLQIVKTTLSVKTKIAIIQMLSPRLTDPKVMHDEVLGLFRYSDEKCLVEEALRLRALQMGSSVFKQNPTLSVSSGRGGAGRGGVGRGVGSGRGNMIENRKTPKTSIIDPSNIDINKDSDVIETTEEVDVDNNDNYKIEGEEEELKEENKDTSETFDTPSKVPRRRMSLNIIRRSSFDDNNNSKKSSPTTTSLIDDLLEIRKSISVSTLKQKLEDSSPRVTTRGSRCSSFDGGSMSPNVSPLINNNRRTSRTLSYDSDMNLSSTSPTFDSPIANEFSPIINSNKRESLKVSFNRSATPSPVTSPTNIDPPVVDSPNHISIDVPITVTPIPSFIPTDTINTTTTATTVEEAKVSSLLGLFKPVGVAVDLCTTTNNTSNNYPNEIAINTEQVIIDIKEEEEGKDIKIVNSEKNNCNLNSNCNKEIISINKIEEIIKDNIKSPIVTNKDDLNNKNNNNLINNSSYNSPNPLASHSSWNHPVEEIYYTASISVARLAKKIDTKTAISPLPSNNISRSNSFAKPITPKKIVNIVLNNDSKIKVNSSLNSNNNCKKIITDHNGLISLSPELSIGIENNIHLFSYQELVRKNYVKSYDDVDKASLENHLNDIDFNEKIGMNKAEFQLQPKWKRISKKKLLLLF
jgi:hypothetical protein